MRNYKGWSALCAAAALFASHAMAQTESAGSSGSKQTSPAGMEKQSKMPLAPGQDQVLFRAKELVGKNVGTPQGQKLGKLQDIVFHPEVGTYGLIALEQDDSKLVPVPWSLVTAVTDRSVVVNTTKETLAAAPALTEKQLGEFNKAEFTDKIDSHFTSAMGGSQSGAEGAASTPEPASSSAGSGSASAATNVPAATSQPSPSGE